MKATGSICIRSEKGALNAAPGILYAEREDGKSWSDFAFEPRNGCFECVIPLTQDNVSVAAPYWKNRNFTVTVEQEPIKHPFSAAELKKWKAEETLKISQERETLVSLKAKASEMEKEVVKLDKAYSDILQAYQHSANKAEMDRIKRPELPIALTQARVKLGDLSASLEGIKGEISKLEGGLP